MGFLRRLRGEPTVVPDWASSFTADEYEAFLAVVRADLERRGGAYTIGEGSVRVNGSDGEFGLSNLAQVCHAMDRGEWPTIVATHFSNLRATAGRDTGALAADFDQVRPILRVRVFGDESMGGMSPGDISGSRPCAPGILLTLVYDFPDSTRSVPLEHLEGWPLDADAVWQIAIDNTRLEAQPIRQTVPVDGASFELATGDGFYVATGALLLADEMPTGIVDAVFAVPNRHMLLWHVMRDLSVVAVMRAMMQVTSKAFLDGPGSISNQLYWWHEGQVVHLPMSAQENRIAFTPPDAFLALLNTLAAP